MRITFRMLGCIGVFMLPNSAMAQAAHILPQSVGKGKAEAQKVGYHSTPHTRTDTPLLLAAADGDLEAVKRLLQAGADPTKANEDGITPLMNAASGGQIVTRKPFGSRKDATCLVDGEIDGYKTSMHQVLLVRGKIWEGSAWLKLSPLPPANMAVVKLLIQYGAEVNARTPEGKSAFWWAVRTGQIGAAGALLARWADLNQKESEIGTPLLVATATHQADMARILLARRADPNIRGVNGQLPLMRATFAEDKLLTTILLEHGADPNAIASVDDQPLLSTLIVRHKFAMARLLLAHGADPNRKDSEGATALFEAMKGENGLIVRDLLAYGADPNAVDNGGTAPLIVAANSVVLTSLLEKRVDVHTRTLLGDTALHLAAARNDSASIRTLLAGGLQVDERESWEMTPLMKAAQAGSIESIQLLLEIGASIAAVDSKGETALHHAAQEQTGRAITLLLERGAKIDVRNRWNQTPLIEAALSNCPGAVKALLAHHADATVRDVDGHTAHDYAVITGKQELISLLP